MRHSSHSQLHSQSQFQSHCQSHSRAPRPAGWRTWFAALVLGTCLAAPVAASATPAVDTRAPVREYVEAEQRRRLDALHVEYGRLKELPPGFELQALLALSHYPELKNVHIRFIVDDVDIPLSSRPHWPSMLRAAQDRTYLVVIDNARDGPREALLLENQPFNAQVGILGHELAHTVYYLNRGFFGIARDGLCQFSRCRVNFERDTDRRLIEYGLGWQRYDHALFLRRAFAASEAEAMSAEGGGGAYMSPAELRQEMQKFQSYAD